MSRRIRITGEGIKALTSKVGLDLDEGEYQILDILVVHPKGIVESRLFREMYLPEYWEDKECRKGFGESLGLLRDSGYIGSSKGTLQEEMLFTLDLPILKPEPTMDTTAEGGPVGYPGTPFRKFARRLGMKPKEPEDYGLLKDLL